jgi:tRNA (cytosine38-C5)-methyltransferase
MQSIFFEFNLTIQNAIEHIPFQKYEKLVGQNSIFTMSPPCQPYTRGGLQKDITDMRARSFVYLMTKILPHLTHKPKYIFVENVKNFETSQSRELLIKTLMELNYKFQEYLLSPTQIGIPNERLRYYLSAKLVDDEQLNETPPIQTEFPTINVKYNISSRLGDYLLDDVEDDLFIPENILFKNKGYRFDIVHKESTTSSCVTKAYGSLNHMKGTGPLVATKVSETEIDWHDANTLLPFGLRLLHPMEIARFSGFPESFTFPESLSTVQCLKLLGNSLNVTVVSYLMTYMLSSH